MKRRTIVGLIVIAAVVAVVMFAGCVEEETPTPAPESTVEYSEEMVYKELIHLGPEGYTIANQLDALVGTMRAQGIETDIVDGYAKHKSGNVWEVGTTVISGGERYLYKWNYNIETKEIIPLTEMAKDLWYE